jgi:hypothetical protein
MADRLALLDLGVLRSSHFTLLLARAKALHRDAQLCLQQVTHEQLDVDRGQRAKVVHFVRPRRPRSRRPYVACLSLQWHLSDL